MRNAGNRPFSREIRKKKIVLIRIWTQWNNVSRFRYKYIDIEKFKVNEKKNCK